MKIKKVDLQLVLSLILVASNLQLTFAQDRTLRTSRPTSGRRVVPSRPLTYPDLAEVPGLKQRVETALAEVLTQSFGVARSSASPEATNVQVLEVALEGRELAVVFSDALANLPLQQLENFVERTINTLEKIPNLEPPPDGEFSQVDDEGFDQSVRINLFTQSNSVSFIVDKKKQEAGQYNYVAYDRKPDIPAYLYQDLYNKKIAISPGHGYYYHTGYKTYKTQREGQLG